MAQKKCKLKQNVLLLTLLFILNLITCSALAADREIVYSEEYCFTNEDFATADASAAPKGVMLTEVPAASVGAIFYGTRQLRAGDAIPYELFPELRFVPNCAGDELAEIKWLPVFSSHPAPEVSLLINIGNGKNQPPVMENANLETYRNLSVDGKLSIKDPDDTEFSFSLTAEPKRGTVALNQDGSYVYTPDKNKVGKDKFTIQATDSAGNCTEATIHVTITKPTDRTTFADLGDDSNQYIAMWLREQGIYAGESMSGTLLFQPSQTVSRGEFLVMAMELLDLEPAAETLSTGFADEEDTPAWMRPYLVAALRNGFISGVQSEDGLVFRHSAAVTQAEAAVMLSRMLGLDSSGSVSVFADELLPTWAVGAVSCLSDCGVIGLERPSDPMTMLETAKLLRQIHAIWKSDQLSTSLLAWAAET